MICNQCTTDPRRKLVAPAALHCPFFSRCLCCERECCVQCGQRFEHHDDPPPSRSSMGDVSPTPAGDARAESQC